MYESESLSVVSDSLRPHGLYSPWNSPGQNTGVGSCSLLQGIFPTQGWNPGLPHRRRILYQLSHRGSLKWVFLNYMMPQQRVTVGIIFLKKDIKFVSCCIGHHQDLCKLFLSSVISLALRESSEKRKGSYYSSHSRSCLKTFWCPPGKPGASRLALTWHLPDSSCPLQLWSGFSSSF